MSDPSIDLVVLTLNEERNLARCLASVNGLVDSIFVVDSGSTDATVRVAERFNANVVEHPFVNQAQQLNWALENLPIRSDWILRLDADEYLLPALKEELHDAIRSVPDDVSGMYLRRRLIFLGRWIRHGEVYPTWILRAFRTGAAISEEIELNEHMILRHGRGIRLKNDFVNHQDLGLKEWLLKHEAYADRHARFLTRLENSVGMSMPPTLRGTQAQQRRWRERNFYARFPLLLRPLGYFIYRYFIRLGFLDGREGAIFHVLHAFWYRFYIDAKIFERQILVRRTHGDGEDDLR